VRQRLDADVIEQLVDAYLKGATAKQLGERYGLAKSTVLVILRGAGVAVRHRRFSSAEAAQVVELYLAGRPQTEIAQLLGRSPSAVWHALRRAGCVGTPPQHT
jgi:DNA-binding CsgD family transcriptional regulator